MKTLKWHLSMMLRLDRVNDTGKSQRVRGKVVLPGEIVRFERDEGLWGY